MENEDYDLRCDSDEGCCCVDEFCFDEDATNKRKPGRQGKPVVSGGGSRGAVDGVLDFKNILADFPGNHPVLRMLRVISKLRSVAFTAIWLAVVLVNSILAFIARSTVVAIEVVCAMLDWVGADY